MVGSGGLVKWSTGTTLSSCDWLNNWGTYQSDSSCSMTTTTSWPSITAKSLNQLYTSGELEEAFFAGSAKGAEDSRTLLPSRAYTLPDGAALQIDADGNYRIEDKNAKVTYQANRIREFSPHINASDMAAKFVEYARTLGVRSDQCLGLPMELFINWLIIEAAEKYHDEVPPDVVRPQEHRSLKALIKPQCLSCGRFIPRLHQQHNFPFCGPEHGMAFVRRRTTRNITVAP